MINKKRKTKYTKPQRRKDLQSEMIQKSLGLFSGTINKIPLGSCDGGSGIYMRFGGKYTFPKK